jgi:hypothetical protein
MAYRGTLGDRVLTLGKLLEHAINNRDVTTLFSYYDNANNLPTNDAARVQCSHDSNVFESYNATNYVKCRQVASRVIFSATSNSSHWDKLNDKCVKALSDTYIQLRIQDFQDGSSQELNVPRIFNWFLKAGPPRRYSDGTTFERLFLFVEQANMPTDNTVYNLLKLDVQHRSSFRGGPLREAYVRDALALLGDLASEFEFMHGDLHQNNMYGVRENNKWRPILIDFDRARIVCRSLNNDSQIVVVTAFEALRNVSAKKDVYELLTVLFMEKNKDYRGCPCVVPCDGLSERTRAILNAIFVTDHSALSPQSVHKSGIQNRLYYEHFGTTVSEVLLGGGSPNLSTCLLSEESISPLFKKARVFGTFETGGVCRSPTNCDRRSNVCAQANQAESQVLFASFLVNQALVASLSRRSVSHNVDLQEVWSRLLVDFVPSWTYQFAPLAHTLDEVAHQTHHTENLFHFTAATNSEDSMIKATLHCLEKLQKVAAIFYTVALTNVTDLTNEAQLFDAFEQASTALFGESCTVPWDYKVAKRDSMESDYCTCTVETAAHLIQLGFKFPASGGGGNGDFGRLKAAFKPESNRAIQGAFGSFDGFIAFRKSVTPLGLAARGASNHADVKNRKKSEDIMRLIDDVVGGCVTQRASHEQLPKLARDALGTNVPREKNKQTSYLNTFRRLAMRNLVGTLIHPDIIFVNSNNVVRKLHARLFCKDGRALPFVKALPRDQVPYRSQATGSHGAHLQQRF